MDKADMEPCDQENVLPDSFIRAVINWPSSRNHDKIASPLSPFLATSTTDDSSQNSPDKSLNPSHHNPSNNSPDDLPATPPNQRPYDSSYEFLHPSPEDSPTDVRKAAAITSTQPHHTDTMVCFELGKLQAIDLPHLVPIDLDIDPLILFPDQDTIDRLHSGRNSMS